MKNLLMQIIILIAVTGATANSYAAGTIEASNREERRSGVYLGLLGDPYPTLVGVNFAHNVTDFFRATAGLGRISASASFGNTEVSASATTFGVGTRFMVPGWSLTPVGGLSFAHVSVSGDGSVTVGDFDESGSHIYATLGLDWQAENGFNVAVGYNISFKSGIGGTPYVNLGWFFDLI